MFGKLLNATKSSKAGANELPTPDLSRIFKSPSPAKAESGKIAPEADDVVADEPVGLADDGPSAPTEADLTAWLQRDVSALKTAFDTYAQRVSSKDARRQLFIASHKLRGTAEPFGNPVLGRLAGSLCNLLERTDSDEPVVALANLHVEAMRAAMVTGESAASDELAQTVCVALEDQVAAKVVAEA